MPEGNWTTLDSTDSKGLWGIPLWVNITPDGYWVGWVHTSMEEAEKAAKESIFRLETIRIQ